MTYTPIALASILALALPLGCGSSGSYIWASQLPAEARPAEPLLREGDKIQVVVYGQDALSLEYEIKPGGEIVLPVVGAIPAAGTTPRSLAVSLTARLQGKIADPKVSVVLTSRRPAGVSVVGEVQSAGRFELHSGEGVLDAIARARGLTAFARHDSIYVIRKETTVLRIRFRYEDLVHAERGSTSFELKDGDVVVVE